MIKQIIRKFFNIEENKTSITTEVLAGLTTFLTMAYIIFVNPNILGFVGLKGLEGIGLPHQATIAMTCFAAGTISILMGLFSNYPLALASGMGFNALVAFSLVVGLKLSWPQAMGIVFLEGIIITILVLTNVRELIMNAIPLNLKKAIGVGIGILITIIGFQNAGLMVSHPATLFSFGKIFISPGHFNKSLILSLIGIIITAIFFAKKIRGAIFWGIILTTLVGILMGITKTPSAIVSQPDFSTFGQIDVFGAIKIIGLLNFITVVFSLMMIDFFDTMGTVIAVCGKAGFIDQEGKLPRLKNVLLADSLGAAFGGFCNASSVTSYIESAAGVAEGGRTGLTSVTVGILFLLAMLFTPLAGIVPKEATAPALIIVGFIMIGLIREIPFKDFSEGFPAFLTIIGIPLSFEISRGIGYGFISYTLIKLGMGKFQEVHPLLFVVSLLFALSFLVVF